MKAITLRLLSALALLSCSVASLLAQSQEAKTQEVIIITKTASQAGGVEQAEQRLTPGEDLQAAFERLRGKMGEKAEWHLFFDEQSIPAMDAEPGEEVFFFRRSKPSGESQEQKTESLKIFMHGDAPLSKEEAFMRGYGGPAEWESWQSTRAFLGIHPGDTEHGEGVAVAGIVPSAPAHAAGLQRGDIILSIAGNSVNGSKGLRETLRLLDPNETVPVRFLRDGQEMEVLLTLGRKNQPRRMQQLVQRDPCQVFIGLYSSSRETGAQGLRVNGVIADTPAEAAGIRTGDVVLAMNGAAVSSYSELIAERDKCQPGQVFELKVLRDGHEMRIEARFASCDPEDERPASEEIAPVETPELPLLSVPELPGNTLELEEYKAFPNPAFSYFNLQFRAAPVPTQIQLTDITGRVVFQRQLNRFDGYFNEEILLNDAAAGLLTLTIRQGDKVVSKQVLLLNRA
jgi:hypothetical protein